MFTQIISNTPKWGFVLFFVLLALGLSQMRSSTKEKNRVLIFPIVLFFLSIAGVVSAFGYSAMPIAAWAVGYLALLSLMARDLPSKGNFYDATTKRLTVAGSALPLALFMGLFFLRALL